MGSTSQLIEKDVLLGTVSKLFKYSKGILAADESPDTMGKRFKTYNIDNTYANRGAYRKLLFTTPYIEEYISGCILHSETFSQKDDKNVPLVDYLTKEGVLLGIKLDLGLEELPTNSKESRTKGLDDLDKRCKLYQQQGATFAKWRTTIKIEVTKDAYGNDSYILPTEGLIKESANSLATYAIICQHNKIVPIVEPEVLSTGDHSAAQCSHVMDKVISELVHKLKEFGVFLEGCILKPNMALAGDANRHGNSHETVAYETLEALLRSLPPAIGGVAFLSGGQSEKDVDENLHRIVTTTNPYFITFCYGRALQATAIEAWKGVEANVTAAQKAFMDSAKRHVKSLVEE